MEWSVRRRRQCSPRDDSDLQLSASAQMALSPVRTHPQRSTARRSGQPRARHSTPKSVTWQHHPRLTSRRLLQWMERAISAVSISRLQPQRLTEESPRQALARRTKAPLVIPVHEDTSRRSSAGQCAAMQSRVSSERLHPAKLIALRWGPLAAMRPRRLSSLRAACRETSILSSRLKMVPAPRTAALISWPLSWHHEKDRLVMMWPMRSLKTEQTQAALWSCLASRSATSCRSTSSGS
mmetsp:Transcript_27909/g.66300  ORF Transcript_27909/g.66300 Transcript_27909/m.66300 type:complete len:238 (+) Transcript_27909:508-1221(+)